MINKILPTFLLASTFIAGHGHAMEIVDISDQKMQGLIRKMENECPVLSEIYKTPREQRKACIDKVYNNLPHKTQCEIAGFMGELIRDSSYIIKDEIGFFCISSKHGEDILNSEKERILSRKNEESSRLEAEIKNKVQQGQSMKNLLTQAENDACSFAPGASDEQLNQVKAAFLKCIKDYDDAVQRLGSNNQLSCENFTAVRNTYSSSYITKICSILNVDRNLISNGQVIESMDKFRSSYDKEKFLERGVLQRCEFQKKYLDKLQEKLAEIEIKTKKLGKPIFLFTEDVYLISDLLLHR